jgi:hypothetical protein
MNKNYYHRLPFYLRLSPFFIANSLVVHIIVLSFLLTLPVYTKDNEKKSLWGYYVYLTGEETSKPQLSAGRDISDKQTEAPEIAETAMISGNVIEDVKDNEATVQTAKSEKESGNDDEDSEKNIVENHSEIKQTEIDTNNKSMDTKPLSAELKKEDKNPDKGLDITEKTETERIVPADHMFQTEKSVKTDVLQPPSRHDASAGEIKLPEGNSLLTGQQSAAIIEKDKMIDNGKNNREKPKIQEQVKSIKGENKLSIITPEKNIANVLLQKGGTYAASSPALNAEETEPVRQKDYPETPKTSEVILSGTDHTQKEKAISSTTEHTRTDIEKPVVVLHPSSEKDISEAEMNLPENNHQVTGQPSAVIMENVASPEKREAIIEKPLMPGQLSDNNTARVEKKAIDTADKSGKALSEKIADAPGDKKALTIITGEKPDEKVQLKESSVQGIPSSSKTGAAVSVEKNEIKTETHETIFDPGPSKKTSLPERSAQNNLKEDLGKKFLSATKEKASLLSDIENISRQSPLKLPTGYKKIAVLDSVERVSVITPALTRGGSESNIGTGKAEIKASDDKGTEEEMNTAAEDNEQIKKGTDAKVEKSSIGLPLAESLFYKDIKIEVLQENSVKPGIFMYLLKNPYLSLGKRHKWGKEKIIETDTETKKKNGTEEKIVSVLSVAKTDKGIYTFVIENKNTAPYNTDLLFTLYEGQKSERIKKIKAVSVLPLAKVRFMFVLPDTIFWDDEEFFAGHIEDSDSITKFNDEKGFAWREEKDD